MQALKTHVKYIETYKELISSTQITLDLCYDDLHRYSLNHSEYDSYLIDLISNKERDIKSLETNLEYYKTQLRYHSELADKLKGDK